MAPGGKLSYQQFEKNFFGQATIPHFCAKCSHIEKKHATALVGITRVHLAERPQQRGALLHKQSREQRAQKLC